MAQEIVIGSQPTITGLKERMEAYERRLIQEALWFTGGNQRRAAAALGCLPTTLNEKMRRLGLRGRSVRFQRKHPSEEATLTGPSGLFTHGF